MAAAPPVHTTFPCVSLYGSEMRPLSAETTHRSPARLASFANSKTPLAAARGEIRRDSGVTVESVESSPTNTVSTYGSSMTEHSPSSSPESPPATSPKSVYLPPSHLMALSGRQKPFSHSFPVIPGIEQSDSSLKRRRNPKGLSVNTIGSQRPSSSHTNKAGIIAQTPSAPVQQSFSAPPTPGFILPPKPPRRKQSHLGLSITTPETTSPCTATTQLRPDIFTQMSPETQVPAIQRLRKLSCVSLASPSAGPEGGMRLPPLLSSAGSRSGSLSISSPGSDYSPIKRQTLEHVKEELDHDLPLSQEVKSPAYPDGPVCIYDPNIFLFLEPTAPEAREFDVVFNVAREVHNPLNVSAENKKDQGVQASVRTADKGVQVCFDDTGNNTADSVKHHEQPTNNSKANISRKIGDDWLAADHGNGQDPEYFHVPWDHNTNVVDDLLHLCQIIDERVRQRKRILIHCQCGVSRSASLMVAYGLYRNPSLSVQEAYDAVKSRSRWIGPNMNLIYQLSEFKSKLLKARPSRLAAAPGRSWRASVADIPSRSFMLDMPTSPRRNSMPKPPGPERAATFDNLSVKTSLPVRPFNPAVQAFQNSLEPVSAFPTDRNSVAMSPLSQILDRPSIGLATAIDAPCRNPFSAVHRNHIAPWQQTETENDDSLVSPLSDVTPTTIRNCKPSNLATSSENRKVANADETSPVGSPLHICTRAPSATKLLSDEAVVTEEQRENVLMSPRAAEFVSPPFYSNSTLGCSVTKSEKPAIIKHECRLPVHETGNSHQVCPKASRATPASSSRSADSKDGHLVVSGNDSFASSNMDAQAAASSNIGLDGLMSPRAQDFTAPSFFQQEVVGLGVPVATGPEDPRSPHQKGELIGVTRSLFGVL